MIERSCRGQDDHLASSARRFARHLFFLTAEWAGRTQNVTVTFASPRSSDRTPVQAANGVATDGLVIGGLRGERLTVNPHLS
jgi:hypothetical protein